MSQREELKCSLTATRLKNPKIPQKRSPIPPPPFLFSLVISIVTGKIRTATASAGSCSALGQEKVETCMAEGGLSSSESPQASASSSVLLANQSLCFSCQCKDLKLEEKYNVCLLIQSKFAASSFLYFFPVQIIFSLTLRKKTPTFQR